MHRVIVLCALFVALSLTLVAPVSGQSGMAVNCDTGGSFSNGIAVRVVQMRSGFNYKATAIGINGFDPVIGVIGEDGQGLCNDDSSAAAGYTVNLPTTGFVPGSSLSAQRSFSHSASSGFQDVTLVVGGFGDQTGQFVLVLEGMAVTSGDGAGDPFAVTITPGMINSGIPLTAYMISADSVLDPLMYFVDANYDVIYDDSGNPYGCDDAGNASTCWGQSTNLSNSYVTRTQGRLPGYQYDAMISIPMQQPFVDTSVPNTEATFLATSYAAVNQARQYVMAFHFGIGTGLPPGNVG